jgi:hypothetical protein
MSDGTNETVSRILKALWGLENELRGAAQNSVILRRDDARQHLASARDHLNELLGIVQSAQATHSKGVSMSPDPSLSTSNDNQT